ncbi:permease [Methanoregula sp.]|uniref:permease n=1 Tax=Methanoregula sp. TaxID=2052170 RepID=UPI0035632284
MQNYLQLFADWVTYSVLGLAPGSPLASSVNFFVNDIIWVSLLLAVIVFAVGIVRTFITPQKVKKWVAGRSEGVGNVVAALLGIPTPFCSCSAVPLFIGFVESGVPLGITFSFLIASPLINEVAAAMLFAMFGWQIALIYIVSGLIIAIVAGIIIGRLHLEGEVEEFVWKCKMHDKADKPMTWKDRVDFGISESKSITLKVIPYIVLGIAIGAVIHGYAPADFLLNIAGPDNPLAVPIAVLIGIPLYSNAAGMIPIMQVLTAKGMAMGTALAFMMAVIGLSLPEMIILRKVIRIKLLAVFAGILFISFTLTGYLFNAILG